MTSLTHMTDHEKALAADGGQRADFIQGLRGEEVCFATHMRLPLPNIRTDRYLIMYGTDAEMIAEVDRIAAELGEHAAWEDGWYLVRRHFSAKVVYEAACMPRDWPRVPVAAGTRLAA